MMIRINKYTMLNFVCAMFFSIQVVNCSVHLDENNGVENEIETMHENNEHSSTWEMAMHEVK